MDSITYCSDTEALVKELSEKLPDLLDQDGTKFQIDKFPPERNGNETLSLIRDSSETFEELEKLDTLQLLGTYEEVFSDPEKKEIYDRVYVREYKYIDENGVEQTGIKSEKFGVFAD